VQRRLASLGVAGIALGLFALLAALVDRQGRVLHVDLRVQTWVFDHYHSIPHQIAVTMVDLLSPPVTAAALVIVAAALSVRERSPVAIVTAVAVVAVTAALVLGLKYGLGRPGPGSGGGSTPDGGSFPSGHTASLLIFIGTLGLLLTRAWWRVVWFAVMAVATCVLVGSLIYINVHWLSDTIGSVFLAAAVLALVDLALHSLAGRGGFGDQLQSAKAVDGSPTTIDSREGSGPPFSDSFTAALSSPSSSPGKAP